MLPYSSSLFPFICAAFALLLTQFYVASAHYDENCPMNMLAPDPAAAGTKVVQANVTEGTVLHLWLRAQQQDQMGTIFAQKLSTGENATAIASTRRSDERWFDFFELALEFEGEIEFSWSASSTNVSYIYAFEPEQVLEEGIRSVYISPVAMLPADLTSFHYRPETGWINDPNGFSRSRDGLYHLFSQHHPHTKMWWAMHWGHAVSRDLLHWIPQPVFLHPTYEQQNGGIFSGSAHPEGHGLRIYYADHKDGRTPLEFQRSVLTEDLIAPIGPKVTALADRPPQLAAITTQDFRDPNVFTGPRDELLMVLGSKLANETAGLVLLYRHNKSVGEEPKGWEYQSILHKETRWAINAAECPGLLPLGNRKSKSTLWALIYGAQNSEDGNGRGFLSPIHLGTFDGTRFVSKSEKLIDFVSGSYGYQGFYDQISGESVLIGWLANWPDRDANVDFPTTMTVPRLLKLSPSGQDVLISPHPHLRKLRASKINSDGFKNFTAVNLPNGTADLEAHFHSEKLQNSTANISLAFHHSLLGQKAIQIVLSSEGIQMKMAWKNASTNKLIAENVFPSHLRVLVDFRSVEVFADDGVAVGTTRIPSDGHVQSVQFYGDKPILKSVEMWSVKSTQPKRT